MERKWLDYAVIKKNPLPKAGRRGFLVMNFQRIMVGFASSFPINNMEVGIGTFPDLHWDGCQGINGPIPSTLLDESRCIEKKQLIKRLDGRETNGHFNCFQNVLLKINILLTLNPDLTGFDCVSVY